jgi:hypothetical protein
MFLLEVTGHGFWVWLEGIVAVKAYDRRLWIVQEET